MRILSGYKTYLAAAVMVITEGIKTVFPELTSLMNTIQVFAAGLGLAFIRAGVAKTGK